MLISFTSSTPPDDQAEKIEQFLAEFLPRMRREDGVERIFHYANTRTGEHSTIVIWRDEAARATYVRSELIKEAIAF